MGAEIHWDNAFMFAGREEEILAEPQIVVTEFQRAIVGEYEVERIKKSFKHKMIMEWVKKKNFKLHAQMKHFILTDQSLLRQKKTIIDKWQVPAAVLFAYRDLILFKRYM